MSLLQELIEILHRPKLIHDILVIADIIAVVIIGGLVNRGEPDDVDPQFLQIIEFGCDSL